MTHTYCAVYKCKSKSRREKELRFHKFPRNPQRRAVWIEACGRSDLKTKTDQQLNNMRVCCLHFEKYMYGFGENQLIDVAIPTLNLPPSTSFSVYTQTEWTAGNSSANYSQILVPADVKIKTEIPDSNTGYDSEQQNDNEEKPKRIKIENEMEFGEYTFSNGRGCIPPPNITVEQFLRGCEQYLTPELRQYVKTQIIVPN